jgi:hypothetical protein
MSPGTVPNVRIGDVSRFAEHALDRRSVGQQRLVTDHLVCWVYGHHLVIGSPRDRIAG